MGVGLPAPAADIVLLGFIYRGMAINQRPLKYHCHIRYQDFYESREVTFCTKILPFIRSFLFIRRI